MPLLFILVHKEGVRVSSLLTLGLTHPLYLTSKLLCEALQGSLACRGSYLWGVKTPLKTLTAPIDFPMSLLALLFLLSCRYCYSVRLSLDLTPITSNLFWRFLNPLVQGWAFKDPLKHILKLLLESQVLVQMVGLVSLWSVLWSYFLFLHLWSFSGLFKE